MKGLEVVKSPLLLAAVEQAESVPGTRDEEREARRLRRQEESDFFDLADELLSVYPDDPNEPLYIVRRVTKPVILAGKTDLLQLRVREWKDSEDEPYDIERALIVSDMDGVVKRNLYSVKREWDLVQERTSSIIHTRVVSTIFKNPYDKLANNLEVSQGLQALREVEALLERGYS